MTPRIVGKIPRKSGGVEWPNWALAMFVEMLACRTPPSCVAPLILIISSYILPDHEVVRSLPAANLIREAKSLLCFITKALASKELAGVETYKQMFFDGTKRRGTPIENVHLIPIVHQCWCIFTIRW